MKFLVRIFHIIFTSYQSATMIRRIAVIFAILVVSASAFVAPVSRNAGE
jgi:hypothetical protein